jgi:hypothetical protein
MIFNITYRNICGLINWQRQKFSQFYLNYLYILLRSVPAFLKLLCIFGALAD